MVWNCEEQPVAVEPVVRPLRVRRGNRRCSISPRRSRTSRRGASATMSARRPDASVSSVTVAKPRPHEQPSRAARDRERGGRLPPVRGQHQHCLRSGEHGASPDRRTHRSRHPPWRGPAGSTGRHAGPGILQDHRRTLLGDHHGRRVGVARGDSRHGRGIDDPKPVDAPDAQALVEHRHGIAVDAHPRRADGMEDRRADLAGRPGQVLLRRQVRAGLVFLGPVARQRGRGDDAADELQRIGGDPAVFAPPPDSSARSRAARRGRRSPHGSLPRLAGRRLHTLAVIAGKSCSGSPNLSSESGWT